MSLIDSDRLLPSAGMRSMANHVPMRAHFVSASVYASETHLRVMLIRDPSCGANHDRPTRRPVTGARPARPSALSTRNRPLRPRPSSSRGRPRRPRLSRGMSLLRRRSSPGHRAIRGEPPLLSHRYKMPSPALHVAPEPAAQAAPMPLPGTPRTSSERLSFGVTPCMRGHPEQ